MELNLALRFALFLLFFTRVEGAGYFRIALVLFINPVLGNFLPLGLIILLQQQPISLFQLTKVKFGRTEESRHEVNKRVSIHFGLLLYSSNRGYHSLQTMY